MSFDKYLHFPNVCQPLFAYSDVRDVVIMYLFRGSAIDVGETAIFHPDCLELIFG